MPTLLLAIALEPNRRVRKTVVHVSDCQDGGSTFDPRCAADFIRTTSLSRNRRKSPRSALNALSADSFEGMLVDSPSTATSSSSHHLCNLFLLFPGEESPSMPLVCADESTPPPRVWQRALSYPQSSKSR
ncbi:hypothetical protein ARMGADRAFT_1084763 [Armillaria gallica]|uniref:Uncharacterized protein n=1 Tax=Armillaria gallica TaxID=47427 RepID=A0A2H3DLU8_ARMGA|nr:hypothetical protein ARMGADRAFT_1084763 [Armillaria gallica]